MGRKPTGFKEPEIRTTDGSDLINLIDGSLDYVAGSVDNDSLATDVKVGSLATLTTTDKSSVVAAINELDTESSLVDSGTPVNGVAAQGTLTMDTQPTVGDTMTIGSKTYTFTTDGTAASDGEIDVGSDLADCKTLVPAAINGTDGINTANADVTCSAFTGDDAVLTAAVKGVAGNSLATTETFTAVTNVFDATTLGTTTAGVDGTVGVAGQCAYDASYLYVCIATNTIADANWRRISVGSAY